MQNQELFYQGRYQDLLSRTIDSKAGTLADQDLPFVIGALSTFTQIDGLPFTIFEGSPGRQGYRA